MLICFILCFFHGHNCNISVKILSCKVTLEAVGWRAAYRTDGSLGPQNLEQVTSKGTLVGQQTGSKMQSDLNTANRNAAVLASCGCLLARLLGCASSKLSGKSV